MTYGNGGLLFADILPRLRLEPAETPDAGSEGLHVETALARISANEIFVSCVSAEVLSLGIAMSVTTHYTHVRNKLTITFTLLADDQIASRMRAALLPVEVRPLCLSLPRFVTPG